MVGSRWENVSEAHYYTEFFSFLVLLVASMWTFVRNEEFRDILWTPLSLLCSFAAPYLCRVRAIQNGEVEDMCLPQPIWDKKSSRKWYQVYEGWCVCVFLRQKGTFPFPAAQKTMKNTALSKNQVFGDENIWTPLLFMVIGALGSTKSPSLQEVRWIQKAYDYDSKILGLGITKYVYRRTPARNGQAQRVQRPRSLVQPMYLQVIDHVPIAKW